MLVVHSNNLHKQATFDTVNPLKVHEADGSKAQLAQSCLEIKTCKEVRMQYDAMTASPCISYAKVP
jgi:hypothetical protein